VSRLITHCQVDGFSDSNPAHGFVIAGVRQIRSLATQLMTGSCTSKDPSRRVGNRGAAEPDIHVCLLVLSCTRLQELHPLRDGDTIPLRGICGSGASHIEKNHE